MSSKVGLREEAEIVRTAMSSKELRRVGVMTRVEAGELTLVSAAELLGISYRQAIRLKARHQAEGPAGLRHRSVGRRSNRATPKKVQEKVLRLIRQKYGGAAGERLGPTLAAEQLAADYELQVDHETLRRWMLAAGLWSVGRKRRQYRSRRARKEHFGELVQMDGSFDQWLPGSDQKQCLMNMVDDATSTTLCQLHEQETTWAAADMLRAWIEKYGVPQRLYTDWKTVYLQAPTAKQLLAGEEPLTQFGRMCRKLGVRIIGASSPQAKGRVERSNGTHQDRLIKKLRLFRIGSMEGANRYLRQRYLADHNRRFSRPAASEQDYHQQRPSRAELDTIFRLEYERVISNDWVVQYEGRWLQLQPQSRYAPAGNKVLVSESREGKLQMRYRGQAVQWKEIPRPEARHAEPRAEIHHKHAQPASHPWKKAWKTPSMRRPRVAAELVPRCVGSGKAETTSAFPPPTQRGFTAALPPSSM